MYAGNAFKPNSIHAGKAFAHLKAGESSLRSGSAFAHLKPCERKSNSVHCGKFFAAARRRTSIALDVMLTITPTADVLALADDIFDVILDAKSGSADVTSLVAARSVCRKFAPLARRSLSQLTLEDRITALVRGELPPAESGEVERAAAAALVRGSLSAKTVNALMEFANSAVASGQGNWTISSERVGDDATNDLSFPLRGFDSVAVSEREDVKDWWAEHMPSRPLHQMHLPCILAGPPRYIALAGTARQRRQVRKVPLEMCRTISGMHVPMGSSGAGVQPSGVTLITAIFRHVAPSAA